MSEKQTAMIKPPVAAEQQVRLIPDAGHGADGVVLRRGQVVQNARLRDAEQLQIALLHRHAQGLRSDQLTPDTHLTCTEPAAVILIAALHPALLAAALGCAHNKPVTDDQYAEQVFSA